MIKNATIYRVTKPVTIVHDNLEPMAFSPTTFTQQKSLGWVPHGDDYGWLVRVNSGAQVMRLRVETRTVPAATIAEKVAQVCKAIEQNTGRACELKACDESSAKVRYTNHPLLTYEVQTHLAQGKQPTSLAMEFDDRVSFTLTDNLQLKKIDFGDKVMEKARFHDINPGDLDGSLAIAIGEFRPLLAELIAALGGFPETQKA